MGPVKSQTGNLQTLERRPETEEPNAALLRSGWRLRSWVGPIHLWSGDPRFSKHVGSQFDISET